jgi:hypothetical protein
MSLTPSRKFAHAHIVPSRDKHCQFFKGLCMGVPSDREPRLMKPLQKGYSFCGNVCRPGDYSTGAGTTSGTASISDRQTVIL